VYVRDVYAQVQVIEERLNNHIVDAKEDMQRLTKLVSDNSNRITNLENRINKAINNEIAHLRKEIHNGKIKTDGWTWKDASTVGTLIFIIYVMARFIELLITNRFSLSF